MDVQERRDLVRDALRAPRGRYRAHRAAQLSGVPRSTVYEWARKAVLAPDYVNASPMLWSYRDLVFLRLLARMRQHGIPRPEASRGVASLRTSLADPSVEIASVRIAGGLYLGDSSHDVISGQHVFADILALTKPFDLLEPIAGVNDRPTWGPDLVQPSEHTYISPGVMGGEPCVGATRIPTASVFTLATVRRLDPPKIVRLYPQLTPEVVEDAVALERRLRAAA